MEDVAPLRRTRSWLWICAVLYAALILAVSSIPSRTMPDSDLVWKNDKLIHALEYAVFAWLVAGGLRARYSRGLTVVIAAFACASFGVVDELYQSTVPGRAPSVYDALADTVGATIGAVVGAVWWERRQ